MRGRLNEIQVGLVTIIALTVLVWGMLWLKNIDLRKGSRMYQADFSQVEGLRVGDRVQVRGIRMGEVTGMRILPQAVRVELQLEDTAKLCEDATVTLGEKGIVGEVVIEIDPGIGAPVQEGHIFPGRAAGTIAAVTDAAGAALAEMRVLTGQVTALLEEVRKEGHVVETLAQANVTLAKVDRMVDQNHQDVTVILSDLRASTTAMRKLMDSGRLDSALAGTTSAAAAADSLLAGLGDTTLRLNSLLAKLDEGSGSAALLLNDPALYTRTDSTLTSVQRLLDDLRRNPKKYFKLSIIDF
jgi:phospholipid/cholesterol/gamma-HCH transport system substrate-binding protein